MKQCMKIVVEFFVAFLLVAFIVTCNLLLFMQAIDFEPDQIRQAAPITLVNVIFISALFSILDITRRKWSVDRPTQKIQELMKELMKGNYKARATCQGFGIAKEFEDIMAGLNLMAEELSGVETLKTDFISNVSHEMKTPLTVIQNYGTLLQSPGITEEQRQEYAKAITEQTKKMSVLITNILKLNKLENQQIFPKSESFDLGEQLCECMLGFENAWEEKQIELDVNIQEDVQIKADKELLSLVWNNLMSNAVKFTPRGGTIAISLHQENGKAIVMVQDTGCGMNAETGKNIFKKFYQGDTSHATQGNGLGLALVKRVIDIMNADISVSSTVGVGTTFTVKLQLS